MTTVASTHAVPGARRAGAAIARTATWLLVAQLFVSGLLLMARPDFVLAVIRHLGYPDYFPLLLGGAKVLAALAIADPRGGVLAEWAHAGATFDVIAVVLSHAARGDSIGETLAPLVVLALIAASYASFRARKEER
jgi:hypothetical protein